MSTITVFGSSLFREGSAEYEEARHLGQLLAGAGFDVRNGGFWGAMAAVSQGAHEAGGQVHGVTVELFAQRPPNPWIHRETRAPDLIERLRHLVDGADGYVVLAGGVGTLLELTLVWNLTKGYSLPGTSPPQSTGKPPHRRPIVLVGTVWQDVLDVLTARLPISAGERELVTVVPTVDDAVDVLVALQSAQPEPV